MVQLRNEEKNVKLLATCHVTNLGQPCSILSLKILIPPIWNWQFNNKNRLVTTVSDSRRDGLWKISESIPILNV